MRDFRWGSDSVVQNASPTVKAELINLLVGKKLGSGSYREVFENMQDADEVLKIETGARCFSNIHEYNMWMIVAGDPELSKWFAPCVDISPSGQILVMKRTKPVMIDELPKKIPNFLTDTKVQNWGRYKKRIVCHDYGNHLAISKGINNWKLKKAEWWEAHD